MEDDMREEIREMTEKIEEMIERVEVVDNRGVEMFTNMNAYVSDSKHFLKAKNLIKSFEAIVWAWAILEICDELEIFKIER
jgi:hypothetical protein